MTPKLKAVAIAIACVFATGQGQAIGTDPSVVAGQASFSTQGNTQSISNSPGTIINWQGFSIGASESTHFIQQSAASSVLNRVIGPDPSVILGTLTSNGRVFLINPSGILVGQGARIDVAGLVASTLNLSNADFLAGRLNFTPNLLAGKVENQGSITTPSGGSVYLLGSSVSNSGIITSPQGDVILAAGQSVNIYDTSTPGVRVEITAGDNAVVNLGAILAQSGEIGIYAASLRNAGIVNADQVVRDVSGKIVLRAKQDVTLESGSRLSANGEQAGAITVQSETGTTLVSGMIEAKGSGVGQAGGSVQILGQTVNLTGAVIDVSGDSGGGLVLVGGNFHGAGSLQHSQNTSLDSNVMIYADAINSGNGGRIAVWSDGYTSVAATLSARGGANSGDGGFIETSGKHVLLVDSMLVNTLALHGKSGLWLLDPVNWTIALAAGDETPGQVATSLATSSRLITATNDITVTDAVTWSTAQTLTLNAGHNVAINATITASTAGSGITLIAANDILVAATAAVTASANGSVIDMTAGHNVSVGVVTASGGGSVILRANNDVIVNGAITADTGPNPVTLIADNDGNGVGTVVFAGGGQVSSTLTTIRFNPVSYATTGAEIAAYLPKVVAGAMDAKAWVFAQANNKVYDRTTAAALTLKGDPTVGGTYAVTLAPGIATFVDWNAGIGKTLNYTGYNSISGANTVTGAAVSFALFTNPTPGVTTASITPASLSINAVTNSKTYDGGITSVGVVTFTGLMIGDSVTGATQSFDSKNVLGLNGSILSVIPASYTVNDGNTGGNYSVTANTALGTITKAALGINAVNDTKVYDGFATSAGVVTFTGLVGGDSVTGATQTFGSKNVLGLNLSTLSAAGYTVNDGNGGLNYIVTANTATGTITKAALGINAVNDTKVYDGFATSAGVVAFTGLVGGDSVTGATQTFGSKNVLGLNGSTLSAAGYTVNDGNGGLNYTVTANTASGTITKAALGINAVTDTKAYDGFATSAGVVTFTGLVGGDTVTGATQSFGSKNVLGLNLSTLSTAGYTVNDGNTGGNYSVTTSTASGTITALGVTLTAPVVSKTYDGGLTYTTLAGDLTALSSQLIAGDSVSAATIAYTNKNAGSGNKTVALNAATISDGNGGTNYSVTLAGNSTSTITARALTVTAVSDSKTYDGTTGSAVAPSITTGALQTGDTTTTFAQTFDNRSAGSAKTLTASGIVNDGNGGNNYALTFVTDTTGVILARSLTVSGISAANKVYDGTPVATVNSSAAIYTGLIGGDAFSVSASGSFADQNAANGKTVMLSSLYSGADVGNYSITSQVSTTANITPAALSITANNATRLYGDANPAFSVTYTGLQNGESPVVLTGTLAIATPAIPSSNVGSYAVTPSGLSSSNYTISPVDGILSVKPVTLIIAADAKSKLFGTSDPALTFSITGLVNNPALGVVDTAGNVLSGSLTRYPGESALGGPYVISQNNLVANSNYTISFIDNNFLITGVVTEVATVFSPQLVSTGGVINNELYYRPGNFWHISLNPNNADPGFDVIRGTNDLQSRLSRRLNICAAVGKGAICETW